MNTKLITPFASALAILLVLGLITLKPQQIPSSEDPVFTRNVIGYEVLNSSTDEGPVVKYQYKGEKLPEKLAPEEDVSQRTQYSYSKLVSVQNPGTKEERRTYQGYFFSKPTYVQDGNEWYYVEVATTTESGMNSLQKENPLASLFWQSAYAASIAPFSESGDGYIQNHGFETSLGCQAGAWSQARSSSNFDTVDPTTATMWAYSELDFFNNPNPEPDDCDAYALRAFVPFVTSAMTPGSVVTAATLTVFITNKSDGDNDTIDYLTVVRSSQTTHTTLDGDDFHTVGTTEGVDVAQRKDITSITTSAALTFTLNATGMSWIAPAGTASTCSATAGVSCFALREGHDFANSTPANNSQTGVSMSTSEASGTTQDPVLSVTYTPGATFAFWQFQDY